MSDYMPSTDLERRLLNTARAFSYPPTPDIAGELSRKWSARPSPRSRVRVVLAGAALTLALLAAVVITVPEAQAFVRYLFRIGSIEVVRATPTPELQATHTPVPTSVAALSPFRDLAGQTTLAQARSSVRFPIRVPAYPGDFGLPDAVFSQDFGGDAVVLGWLEPGHPDKARMVLYEFSESTYAQKSINESARLQETQIHGQKALWLRGPHLLNVYDSSGRQIMEMRELTGGNTLVWEEGGITYQLESNLSLGEAVKAAESMHTVHGRDDSPTATATPVTSVLNLAGRTTLDDARRQLTYPILLPTYPSELGLPDRVFVQDLDGPAVILVWIDPAHPDKVRYALNELISEAIGRKTLDQSAIFKETRINGDQALWISGEHMLEFVDSAGHINLLPRRLVEGNVLVWSHGAITYRLETQGSMEEAVKIAESLK